MRSKGTEIMKEFPNPECVKSESRSGTSSVESHTEISIPMRTDALVRGFDLVMKHHSISKTTRDAMKRNMDLYLNSSPSETAWQKRVKYVLAFPIAKYLNNELPPEPDVQFRPTHRFRSWMHLHISNFSRKNTHLWYSWLQVKRAALPFSAEHVESVYQDHYSTLSKEDDGDDGIINDILKDGTFKRLLDKIRRGVTYRYNKSESFDQLSPSTNACFERSRSLGGQAGYLREISGVDDYILRNVETVLHSMKDVPVLFARSNRQLRCIGSAVIEYRTFDGGYDEWKTHRSELNIKNIFNPVNCTIQAVLEPMKVRIISKGEAYPYYRMKPLQKAMHSTLRDLDCFRLIGRPFSPCDIMDLKQKSEPNWKWFSIDYSAATDGLSWKYSGYLLEYIIRDLDPLSKEFALRVLGPHRLHYPQRDGSIKYVGLQRNGQLMGSILSFPILCLANLGVYLLNTQNLHEGWSDEERLSHVLVNGDDMVYAAPDSYWESHKLISGSVGLKMATGKAYIHEKYLNINSTSVHCSLKTKTATPWQIDFLNVGLYFGNHKVQTRENESGEYVCNINTILKGSLPNKQCELLSWILSDNKDKIYNDCVSDLYYEGKCTKYVRNLFTPVSFLGMGVEAPRGFRWKTSYLDRLVIGLIRRSVSQVTLNMQLPSLGPQIRDLDTLIRLPFSIESFKERSIRVEQSLLRSKYRSNRREARSSIGLILSSPYSNAYAI